MKKFLSLVLALCMVMTLCSCALAEDVTLSVWVGDNLDMEWINKVIENFKAANPDKNYTIKVDVVGEGDAKSTVLKDVEAAAVSHFSTRLPSIASGVLTNILPLDSSI